MNCFYLGELEQFKGMAIDIGSKLLNAPRVEGKSWQSTDARSEMLVTYELRHVLIEMPVGAFQPGLAINTEANMPWAEDHFQERVSRIPMNPPPSEAWWPYARAGNAEHKAQEQFSHTYPERFWPKFAAVGEKAPNGRLEGVPHQGIRYQYGDLDDVLNLLMNDPPTRQAYLPVWFPEDTGSTEGQRVPCTLGYHFLQREGVMDITYYIRSCDFMRHWRDDIYMAGRLLQWVAEGVGAVPGKLLMNIASLHIFEGDRQPLEAAVSKGLQKVADDQAARLSRALG